MDIKRAVLFATNNALVCDTPEDAMKVAYEIEPHHRYDVSTHFREYFSYFGMFHRSNSHFSDVFIFQAVALDGTFYQKSGIISGGSLDLARKAKRWDEKQMSLLKSKKVCQTIFL